MHRIISFRTSQYAVRHATVARFRYYAHFIYSVGSLEEVVENLVKTWECELSHKSELDQWTTIDKENFFLQTNSGKKVYGPEAVEIGSYNSLLEACPAYQECKYKNI